MKKLLLVISTIILSQAFGQLNEGETVPSFFLPKYSGGSFYMSKIVGAKARPNMRSPLVLSFFQTTCVPCKAEIAEFEKLDVEFPAIPIYLIDLSEPKELVTEYIEKYDLKLRMLMDKYGVTGKKFGVVDENGLAHLPNSFIIDADGVVVYHHSGFKPGDEAIYREKLTDLNDKHTAYLLALEAEKVAADAAAASAAGVSSGGNSGSAAKLAVGDKAPTFFLPRFDGDSFYMSRTVGPKAKPEDKKPVVISFFQTTCVPCKAEISQFQILQEEFPGIDIYLVDLNEDKALVGEYIDRFDLKLEMLMDRYGSVGKKYEVVDARGLAHLPNSFIVGADGLIKYHHQGFKPGDEEKYRAVFQELAAE
ncbi:TlpA family protein disulfide reductase [Candidatus Neomarinimicrobiota bacterium]